MVKQDRVLRISCFFSMGIISQLFIWYLHFSSIFAAQKLCMEYIKTFVVDFIEILNEMSPYLLLGFFFAGLLKVFLPQGFIEKRLKKPNLKSVVYASLLGVPMPLCSCGVIPTGVSLYNNGAGKGSTVSFLISTPQTGVDSILATYALLGLPFALIRPVVALFTGVFGGWLSNRWTAHERQEKVEIETCCSDGSCNDSSCSDDSCGDSSCSKDGSGLLTTPQSKWYRVFKYAFVDFLQDIAKWLVIGVLLASVVSVLVPNNFFEQFIGNMYLEMLVILLVAIPLYVCATGSIPIAAVLMLKGLSPGAALVFLMAGPATNVATITVLRKSLGEKAMWAYLLSIVLGAVAFGSLINHLLPPEWFGVQAQADMHAYHLLPAWVEWGSTILLTLLIINAFYQKRRQANIKIKKTLDMNEIQIMVKGMSCNHCKGSVEKNVGALPSISSAVVNLEQNRLSVQGEHIDLAEIKQVVENLGFEYGGEL